MIHPSPDAIAKIESVFPLTMNQVNPEVWSVVDAVTSAATSEDVFVGVASGGYEIGATSLIVIVIVSSSGAVPSVARMTRS